MINGDRVKQARELRGLTQAELAGAIGVSQAAVAQIEAGLTEPTERHLEAIALQTKLPPSFFRQRTAVDFPLGSLLFRSRKALTMRDRLVAHAYGRLMYEVVETILAPRTTGYPVRIPRLTDDPVTAARVTRSELGLSPDTPISNVINAGEKGGILVLALPTMVPSADAYSVWAHAETEKPVIVVTGGAPGDRLRLSVAHELGHLVMHRTLRRSAAPGPLEADAFTFAAEFLMPESTMRDQLPSPLTLETLAPLKRRWGVSIQALIRRGRDLALITERQYRYLFEQLSARGWRTREPSGLDVPIEKPRAVRKMVEVLYGTPIDYHRLADDTNLSVPLVKQIMEAHAERGDMVATVRAEMPVPRNMLQFARRGPSTERHDG